MPEQIGRYEIVDLLGRGAMGTVYKGFDSSLNRHIAIKVMTTNLEIDPELRARFFREAQAAGSLQHPNIITVFELGESEGRPYIAMEYLPGRDLDDIVAAREPLTVVEKVDLIEQVCRGLAYAHERGVVHRDIKPANIRVTEMGQVKVMDFGVAHLVTSELTQSGMLMGTPYYMAPEIIDGKTIDLRADIFSVGATFYELLAYTRPFQGDDLHAIFNKILNKDPKPLRQLGIDVPPLIEKVIDRALAKRPADRYANMSSMLGDMMEFWETIPASAQARAEISSSLGRTAGKGVPSVRRRRNRKRWLAAAATVALVAASAAVWRTLGPAAPAPAPAGEPGLESPAELGAGEGTPSTTTPPGGGETPSPVAAGEETKDPEPEAGTATQEPEPAVDPAAEEASRREAERRRQRAATRLAAARTAYNAARNSTDQARVAAVQAGAPNLQPSLFGRAESAAARADRSASAGSYQTAVAGLTRARTDYDNARRNAVGMWLARIDSARVAVGQLANDADPASSAYADARSYQQSALAAQEINDYTEALRYLSLAGVAYERAVPPAEPAPEPEVTPPEELGPTPHEIVDATLADLARAIEAEDVAALRNVWVGLNSEALENFSGFFQVARDLKVEFVRRSLVSTGDYIDVTVETTYDFYNEASRRQMTREVPQTFRLGARNGRWVILGGG